jgi:hypothetical protein
MGTAGAHTHTATVDSFRSPYFAVNFIFKLG